jgi:Protein of unknown function (DUF742)
MSGGHTWYDDDDGPLVRPYAVTGGRTRADHHVDLQVITLVMALHPMDQISRHDLDLEHLQILSRSQRPISIAEISSGLQLPLSVVKILAGDLIERRLLIFRSAITPDIQVLQAVINGIRRL